MSDLDNIPADKNIVMTKDMHRAFNAAGCNPACHCCDSSISIAEVFKLATVDDKDEMLCSICTPRKLKNKRKREEVKIFGYESVYRSPYPASSYSGGYTRRHKK